MFDVWNSDLHECTRTCSVTVCHCHFKRMAAGCMIPKERKLRGWDEVLGRWMQLTVSLQLYFYSEDVPVPLHPPSLFSLSLHPSLPALLAPQ